MAGIKAVKFSQHAARSLHAADSRVQEHVKEGIRHLVSSPSLGKEVRISPRGLRCYEVGGYCVLHRLRRGVMEIVSIYRRSAMYP